MNLDLLSASAMHEELRRIECGQKGRYKYKDIVRALVVILGVVRDCDIGYMRIVRKNDPGDYKSTNDMLLICKQADREYWDKIIANILFEKS